MHFHNVEEEMAFSSVVDLHHLGVNLELRLVHTAEAQDGRAVGLDERAVLVIDSLLEGCDLGGEDVYSPLPPHVERRYRRFPGKGPRS